LEIAPDVQVSFALHTSAKNADRLSGPAEYPLRKPSWILADGCEFIASDCVRLVPPGTAAGQLYVESTVPGAWIDVRPLDETLEGGGFVDFERVYPLTTVVTLTAEMSLHGQCFFAWQIDGEMQEPGENTVQFVMDESMTAKALYRAPAFWLPWQMETETPLAGTEAP
jgi:hypothetical protein